MFRLLFNGSWLCHVACCSLFASLVFVVGGWLLVVCCLLCDVRRSSFVVCRCSLFVVCWLHGVACVVCVVVGLCAVFVVSCLLFGECGVACCVSVVVCCAYCDVCCLFFVV